MTLTSFALSLALLPLPAQQPLVEFRGLGSGAADLGDVDGDGVSDFLAGDVLHAVSGRTLRRLFRHAYVLGAPSQLPEHVQGVGDLNGDGYGDILIGASVWSGAALLAPPVRPDRGGLVYSFIDRLVSLTPPPLSVQLPGGFAVLGDLDGDGSAEIAAGWPDAYVFRCPSDHPGFFTGRSGGVVQVYSGRDGTVRSESLGRIRGDAFGGVVARLGDLDGDGLADLGISTRRIPIAPTYFCSFTEGQYTQALSSASGAVLWELPVAPRTMTAIDDVNGDAIADVAMGFPYGGRVELRSGLSGVLLLAIDDALLGPGLHLFGNQILAWSDEDGDGTGDLVVSAPQPLVFPIGLPGDPQAAGPGKVLLLSSRTGERLAFLRGDVRGQEFGGQIARLADLTGDGRPELEVGSPRAAGGGLVQVFATIATTPHRIRQR